MRILFVYPNVTRQRAPQLGIAMISAIAKELGHQIDIFDLTIIPEGKEILSFKAILSNFKPDILAISSRSNEWTFVKKLCRSANIGNMIKIFGGPHPTVSPEDAIAIADIVVIGEGEEIFSEILKKLEKKEDLTQIPGCWVKKDGKIFKNPMRKLISNLDTLPLPNWKFFNNIHYYNNYHISEIRGAKVIGTFEGSRGCPYNCSYCTNAYMQSLYKNGGSWRREKSPERLIEEIKLFRAQYGLDGVFFIDDIVLTKKEKLRRFRDLYRSKIKVPIIFLERPENMTDEKVHIIKEANAFYVSIGIESGDENLRRNLLNRHHSQETIIAAFKTAQKYGLKTTAFTMIGFPGQDYRSIHKTYYILKKAKPDLVQTTIFYPLKRTKLYDMMVQEGLFDPNTEMPIGYYGTNDIELIKYQFLLQYYYLPRFFLNLFLFVRNRNLSNRLFNYFLEIVRKYRIGGISLIVDFFSRILKRKITKLIFRKNLNF